jgi:predicted acyltransferase
MILLVSEGFGFHALLHDPFWAPLARQMDHVPWEGLALWDIIQPAFTFMVGIAMPFAVARRRQRGETFRECFWHAGLRSLKLFALSQVLMCIAYNKLYLQMINVLAQIAITYFVCYLIMQLRFRWQVVLAAAILGGYWLLFVLLPGPDGPYSQLNNIGAVIDLAVQGYSFPAHYVTINFIPSIATTLFGVWVGRLLMSSLPRAKQLKVLAVCASISFAAGAATAPICPVIKRLWTTSYTFYTTGWVLLMMLVFIAIVDVLGYRKPAFPLIVVGMNSTFIYSVFMILRPWIDRSTAVFTGRFLWIGTLAPVAQACIVLLVMWYLCYWLYQRKIFFKL